MCWRGPRWAAVGGAGRGGSVGVEVCVGVGVMVGVGVTVGVGVRVGRRVGVFVGEAVSVGARISAETSVPSPVVGCGGGFPLNKVQATAIRITPTNA